MTKHFHGHIIWKCIKELTLRKSLLSVMFVTKNFQDEILYLDIQWHTLGKNLSNVLSVRKHLHNQVPWIRIKEHILGKSLLSVMSDRAFSYRKYLPGHKGLRNNCYLTHTVSLSARNVTLLSSKQQNQQEWSTSVFIVMQPLTLQKTTRPCKWR